MGRDLFSVAVVVAAPFPANHGTPGHIREMSQALASRGHKIHIICYHNGQDIPLAGITVHRSGRIFGRRRITVGPTWYKPFQDLLLLAKLCMVIWRNKIDVIHAFNYEGALIGYSAKIITGKPMVYYAINNMISELPSYNFIKPQLLAVKLSECLDHVVPRTGDHLTVLSDELFSFLRLKGIPEDKMTVIPAGVDIGMFEGKDPEIMRARYAIGNRPLIVYTGTLDNFQGIDYLLKSMRVVINDIHDAVLLVAGNIMDPAYSEKYRRRAAELGIEGNIIFTHECPLDDIPYILAAADVAVLPRPECPGFPIKLLNYMAAGKAIVVFEGSAKGLKNMLNAIVVKGCDWEEFGKGAIKVLRDKRLAAKLGANARKAIEGRFDWPSLTIKLERIYRRLLDESGPVKECRFSRK